MTTASIKGTDRAPVGPSDIAPGAILPRETLPSHPTQPLLSRNRSVSTELFPLRAFSAFLFDMDGTLLTSIEASERVWSHWASSFGLNAADFLPQSHGMRVVEVIERLALPGIDPVAEADLILQRELADVDGVRAIRGAKAFLDSLPQLDWAIVTSAPRALALRRLDAAGLAVPAVLITAEDIAQGKPDPSCYRLAASRLGTQAEDCLVFEDAPAGVSAGLTAGAAVLLITAAHTHLVETDLPSVVDYTGCRIAPEGGGYRLWYDE